MTDAAPDLTARPCGPDSREAQAALFRRCFKKPLQARDLSWRYDHNPHGTAESWALVEPSGRLACSFAYGPRKMLCFGDEATLGVGGQQGDVMTDPDWRRKGLATRLAAVCEEATRARGWTMNWGFPNRQSAPVFTKIGWETVGVIRPWTFYLSGGAAARALRFGEGRIASALLPLTGRARCRAGWRRSLAACGGHKPYWRLLGSFPPEVDALARAVEKRFALMIRRDKTYLDWRFFQAPSGLHRVAGLYERERFRGYVVVQLPRPGERLGYLVDLLAEDDAAAAGAILAALDLLDFAGAAAVRATAVDGSWWSAQLARAGFLPPKRANHLWVYVRPLDPAHALMERARDASKWYLTDGDRDDETMG